MHFAWDIHRYFVLMVNANDSVTRKWLAPGSHRFASVSYHFSLPLPNEGRALFGVGIGAFALTKQRVHCAGSKEVVKHQPWISAFHLGRKQGFNFAKKALQKGGGGGRGKDYSHRP